MRWRGSCGVISCRISCHLFLWLLAVGLGRGVSPSPAQKFKIWSRFAGESLGPVFSLWGCDTITSRAGASPNTFDLRTKGGKRRHESSNLAHYQKV